MSQFKSLTHTISFLCYLTISNMAYAGISPYADTVIINGDVITADNDDPNQITFAEAIAVQGDKIIAVGSNVEIRALVADWTEVIDAKGNSVTPGYIDTHNHIYESSTGFPWVVNDVPDLLEIHITAETPEQMAQVLLRAVTARAGQIAEGKWIRIRMDPAEVVVPAYNTNLINRPMLDQVAPNHPVFVTTRGGSVLNTKAIESFQNYYGNKMPEDYWMVDSARGWSGEYTDFSRCSSLDLISGQDQETYNKYIRGYFEVMQTNAQIGVTTYKSHIQCEAGFSATNHMDRNDLMPIRMAWDHRWLQPFSDSIKESYRRIGDWLGHGSDFMFSTGSSVGGIDAGGVGWCTSMIAKSEEIKKREQCPPEPEGMDLKAIEAINTAPNRGRRTQHLVTLAELASENRISNIPGWHASGDGSVEMMFSTYRRHMSDERIKMLRTTSDHCHSVTPEEIQIAARIGHTFSCDASATPTKVIKEGYGEEYLTWNAPVASMMKAGANAVISEFGIQSELRDSPFEHGVMWLTRKIDGETWGVPEEAVPDRLTLLLMMTRWSAYPIWKEHALGSIEVGKFADIVILNGNYMTTPVEELDQLTSILTMIGGKVSSEASELRGNTFRFNTDTADWTIDMQTPTSTWRWTETPEIPPFLNGANGF
ncbi:MAG: putative amidohydrolase YtcJ [Gammaproteobacteria bacterium]|jgi:predicted amidohydrolase YtcJ